MFDKLKRKLHREPTHYLFIGEQQCLGGYDSLIEAFDAAKSDSIEAGRVYADPKGETLIAAYEKQPERFWCCEGQRCGWRIQDTGTLAYQTLEHGMGCKNPHALGSAHIWFPPEVMDNLRRITGQSAFDNGDPIL